MPHSTAEKEISLLELLKTRPDAGQRDMAEAVGLSLGMTNLLLKQIASKGWMMVRRVNARNFQYVLTPEGMKELSRRSYRYLKKSIRSMAECRVRLEALVVKVKREEFVGIVLVGESGVDFVLEFLCHKHGVDFNVERTRKPRESWFVVYGENEPAASPNVLEYLEIESTSGATL